MRAVYSTTSPAEAESLRALLRGHDVECCLENEGGAMYALGIPTSAVPFVLSVGDQDEGRARAILAGHDVDDPEDAAPGEPPSEIPILTSEEEARFRDRLKEGSRRSRSRWALVLVLIFGPATIMEAMGILTGDWPMIVGPLLAFLVLLGPAILFHVSARQRRIV